MLAAARAAFPTCDGLIGAAAPCDYRPVRVEPHKITKTGQPLQLNLVETEDIVATLGASKRPHQWLVGFALEIEDPRLKALAKLEKKHCDLIVLNGPAGDQCRQQRGRNPRPHRCGRRRTRRHKGRRRPRHSRRHQQRLIAPPTRSVSEEAPSVRPTFSVCIRHRLQPVVGHYHSLDSQVSRLQPGFAQSE